MLMLTTKTAEDGEDYHFQLGCDEVTDEYSEELGDWILDERGEKIPAHICLCFARAPGECCCGCTSWDNYTYDEDWD